MRMPRAHAVSIVAGLLLVSSPWAFSEAVYAWALSGVDGRPRKDAPPLPSQFARAAWVSLEGPLPFGNLERRSVLGLAVEIAKHAGGRHVHHCGPGLPDSVALHFLREKRGRARTPHLRWMALAIWVSREMSHEEALAAWAHYGWFGAGNLRASAVRLFRKRVDQLSWAEFALVLTLHHGGGRDQNRRRARRDLELRRWHEAGLLDEAELARALVSPIPTLDAGVDGQR